MTRTPTEPIFKRQGDKKTFVGCHSEVTNTASCELTVRMLGKDVKFTPLSDFYYDNGWVKCDCCGRIIKSTKTISCYFNDKNCIPRDDERGFDLLKCEGIMKPLTRCQQ